MLNYTCFFV